MGSSITTNNLAEIKSKDYDLNTLMLNNDSLLFANFHEENSIKYLNEEIFKEKVLEKITSRNLKNPKQKKHIIVIRGYKPFLDCMYDLSTHKHYSKLTE